MNNILTTKKSINKNNDFDLQRFYEILNSMIFVLKFTFWFSKKA